MLLGLQGEWASFQSCSASKKKKKTCLINYKISPPMTLFEGKLFAILCEGSNESVEDAFDEDYLLSILVKRLRLASSKIAPQVISIPFS
jgi:hypothetical protein